ncbi:GntR family transcriptional regulator [Bradyrhizobium sp. CCGUVB1N3]|uniref:GntR family transcriptional regulator n=1 Tax=Bradyrhizobium sp. CCGUVB1N3 TaxID=2949629 RepID=UPI0020B38779|nr:GntR family transcriptional regulator [Bradyrhizobium sp. CCGUVB1N3]MCP3473518.1 GntR family transcriptional regulator [Bradyrhizobium sp. CCGUVB1N3]
MVNTTNAKANLRRSKLIDAAKTKTGKSKLVNIANAKAKKTQSAAGPAGSQNLRAKFQHASRPLHEMVRITLQERIQSGAYSRDIALPSVPTLADEFGVSAITLKRALRDLKMAGLVRSVAGLGTFIREQERFVLNMSAALKLSGMKDDALRSRRSLRIKLLSIAKSEIQEPALLPFNPPTQIYLRVEKMIFVDEIPIAFDRAFISLPIDQDFIDSLGARFIYEIMRGRQMPVISNRMIIDAAPPAEDAQVALGIPDGYPTLRKCYHFVAGAPPIRVYGISVSPFDRVACSLDSSEAIHT